MQKVYNGAIFNTLFEPATVVPQTPDKGKQDLDFYNLSAEYNWDFGPAKFTFVPAFRHTEEQYELPLGFLDNYGYGVGSIPAKPTTSNVTSLEARISGENDRLKYVAGLYFYNDHEYEQYTIYGGSVQNAGITSG